MAGPSSTNHIPLMLSNNAIPHRQTPASAANSIQEHGLTVSALDRASDEMRRLAAQGMAFRGDELAQDVGESFHTPMPDAPDDSVRTEPARIPRPQWMDLLISVHWRPDPPIR